MKNGNDYRVTILLNEEEYKKLKYIAEYLKKYSKDNGSIPKLSSKLLFILLDALDDKKIESRTAILSTLDKESKEKNIKAMIENIQNDQDSNINTPKIIEDFAFLSNIQKAIKKMEDSNIETTKESEKTENKNKETENKKNIGKEEKKVEENKPAEEKQQKETQPQKEEKTETKVENKENKEDDEDIMVFPDL
jgi:outer membrane biosynthesis protein TonB